MNIQELLIELSEIEKQENDLIIKKKSIRNLISKKITELITKEMLDSIAWKAMPFHCENDVTLVSIGYVTDSELYKIINMANIGAVDIITFDGVSIHCGYDSICISGPSEGLCLFAKNYKMNVNTNDVKEDCSYYIERTVEIKKFIDLLTNF